jgi:glycosyltransferase involved in cell wall biosynthesis
MSKLANVHRDLRSGVALTGGDWVVCQIGARENYAVARALHRHGRLAALFTDAWSPDIPGLGRIAPRFAARGHAELKDAAVMAPTLRAISRELRASLAGVKPGMDRNIQRNEWFQSRVTKAVREMSRSHPGPLTLFAYSYEALAVLEFAKAAGWRVVLGQMDPGIVEERIVQGVDPQGYSPLPASYWASWRRELELADVVMANSDWTRAALETEGVSPRKIAVVPLAYEGAPRPRIATVRSLPNQFSSERPLRVLFLGQIIPRKGVRPLLDAIRELQRDPIEFHFVGPSATQYVQELRGGANVVWHGPVSRDQTQRYYEAADVFILPTFSDGFGLTQLEAMSFGLPVIASRRCGEVVRDRQNGLILEAVSSRMIVDSLRALCDSPALVSSLREGAIATRVFGIDDLYERLASLPTG